MPSFSLNDEQVLKKNKLLSTEVKQIKLIETKGIVHLVNSFGNASFEARNIGRAAKLYHNKLRTDTSIIWSLSGSLFSAGLRQITIDAIRKNCVDALVCTGALFEQDMLEALGHKHYKCDVDLDDSELQDLMIDRVYDHLLDEVALRQVDLTFKEISKQMPDGNYSSREFMRYCGEWLSRAEKIEDSVMQAAFEKKIPIFIPAINDCSIGIGIALNQKENCGATIDSIKDLKEIALMKSECGNSGIIVVGGGVPKNYSQDSVIMAEMLGYDVEKHNFAIQISTADMRDGGLSGSTLKEAVSWGKNDKHIEEVMVWGEATVFFPLLIGYIFNDVDQLNRKGKELNNIFRAK
tara:strand:- start:1861 stop:2910 length:1050 start_codon:yes stop_codon:yes gene_type:complete